MHTVEGMNSKGRKRGMAKHNLTMLSMSWTKQAFSKGICHRQVIAQRDKFDAAEGDQIPHKLSANVNMTREFAAHEIL